MRLDKPVDHPGPAGRVLPRIFALRTFLEIFTTIRSAAKKRFGHKRDQNKPMRYGQTVTIDYIDIQENGSTGVEGYKNILTFFDRASNFRAAETTKTKDDEGT